VRSFYKPILAPGADEQTLLVVGKICTLVFGLMITTVAVIVSRCRTVGLFDLVNQLAASLTIPLALPLVFGFFHLKTPPWSAWTTVVIGLLASLVVKIVVTAEFVQRLMGWTTPLSPREASDALLAGTVIATLVIAGSWFFATSWFYPTTSAEHRARIAELAERLRTPVVAPASNVSEQIVFRLIGRISVFFGAFILALTLIPNPLIGRMCFVFCGGTIALVGASLLFAGRRPRNSVTASAALSAPGADGEHP